MLLIFPNKILHIQNYFKNLIILIILNWATIN